MKKRLDLRNTGLGVGSHHSWDVGSHHGWGGSAGSNTAALDQESSVPANNKWKEQNKCHDTLTCNLL